MPAPTSKAAAGKSTDGATPPLAGSGSAVCPPVWTRVSWAMALGTRISIATRAAVTSKINFFTRHPPSTYMFLHALHCAPHLTPLTSSPPQRWVLSSLGSRPGLSSPSCRQGIFSETQSFRCSVIGNSETLVAHEESRMLRYAQLVQQRQLIPVPTLTHNLALPDLTKQDTRHCRLSP